MDAPTGRRRCSAPRSGRYSRLVRIEAPDGSLLAGGGSIGERGGFGRERAVRPAAGRAATGRPARPDPPRPDRRGPRLRRRADPPLPLRARLRRRRVGRHPGRPGDVPPAGRRPLRAAASGPAGRRVHRRHGCPQHEPAGNVPRRAGRARVRVVQLAHVQRWTDVLRIPASTAMSPRPTIPTARRWCGSSAERLPSAGPPAATLAGVSYGVVERVTFARRNGRRVVTVVPEATGGVLRDPQADVDWVADQVRQEIVRRLSGQDTATTRRVPVAPRFPRQHAPDPRAARRLVRPQRPGLEPAAGRRVHRHPPPDGARAARRPQPLAADPRARP